MMPIKWSAYTKEEVKSAKTFAHIPVLSANRLNHIAKSTVVSTILIPITR